MISIFELKEILEEFKTKRIYKDKPKGVLPFPSYEIVSRVMTLRQETALSYAMED